MTTTHTTKLVADYLRRLEHAAAPLPRSRRAELVAEIREHIDDALLEAGASDETVVRNVLERLGPPEEIVAAAGVPSGPTGEAGKLEIAALLTLAVPGIGWLVGVPLMLMSRAWSGSEKLVGVLLGLGLPLLLGFVVFGAGAETTAVDPLEPVEPADEGLGPLEVAVLAVSLLSGLVASAYLALRLRRTQRSQALPS